MSASLHRFHIIMVFDSFSKWTFGNLGKNVIADFEGMLMFW